MTTHAKTSPNCLFFSYPLDGAGWSTVGEDKITKTGGTCFRYIILLLFICPSLLFGKSSGMPFLTPIRALIIKFGVYKTWTQLQVTFPFNTYLPQPERSLALLARIHSNNNDNLIDTRCQQTLTGQLNYN